MYRKPCIAARPAYSQSMQPPPYKGSDSDSGRPIRPMLRSIDQSINQSPFDSSMIKRKPASTTSTTFFHDVRPLSPSRREFIIHPELSSENLCPTLHSFPVRQCDIAAALIQRASQRRFVKMPFAY